MSAPLTPPTPLLTALRADARFLTRTASSRSEKWLVALANRGMHALLLHRLSHSLWRRGIPLLPLVLTRLCQHLYAVDIACEAELGPGIVIVHGFGLVIGNQTRIGERCILFHGVTFGDRGSEWVGSDVPDGHPTTGPGCIFGAGAKVLGPVRIGANCVVGANAVVLHDVPPDSIVAGVPGRVVGRRPPMDANLRPLP